jgi:GMP synthase-like glutamine amidotransferase
MLMFCGPVEKKKARRALVIQNVEIEGSGVIGHTMCRAGWELDLRMMEDPRVVLPLSLRGYQALIILGGPMNVYETKTYPYLYQVDELVTQGLYAGVPMLGICLGAQILAKNLGAPVVRNDKPEIGWYDVQLTRQGLESPLFAGLPDHFPVFQWHGDRFYIPEGALHLAASEDCTEQAFSYDDRVFGLQFHLEVTVQMIGTWLAAYHDEILDFGGAAAVAETERFTRKLWVSHYRRALRLARNWLAVCDRLV